MSTATRGCRGSRRPRSPPGSACRSGACPAAAARRRSSPPPAVRRARSVGSPPGTPPRSDFLVLPRTSAASAPSRLTVVPSPGGIRPTAPRDAYSSRGNGGTTMTATEAPCAAAGERESALGERPGRRAGTAGSSRGPRRGTRRPSPPSRQQASAHPPSQPPKPRRCGSDSWASASTSTPVPRMSTPPIHVPRSVWHHTVHARTAAIAEASGRTQTHRGRRPAAIGA